MRLMLSSTEARQIERRASIGPRTNLGLDDEMSKGGDRSPGVGGASHLRHTWSDRYIGGTTLFIVR